MHEYEVHQTSHYYKPETDDSKVSETGGSGMSTAIGSLIDGIFGLIGTGINSYQQDKTNRENRDYATQMTTAQWERDDTSLQRQVKDAELAGLSPLAVTGSMNSSSPLNYVAQAPQMDLSSLIGLASAAGSQIESQKFQASENAKDRTLSLIMEGKKLSSQIDQWNKENELSESEQIDAMVQFNKTMQLQYDILEQQNTEFQANQDLSRLENVSRQSLEQYKSVCSSIGVSPKTKIFKDYNEYVTALNNFWSQYSNLALGRGNSEKSDQTSVSSTDSFTLGAIVFTDKDRKWCIT